MTGGPGSSAVGAGDASDGHFTLADMGKTFSKTLDLRYNYATSWTAKDAFRELLQNWRDAIIQSNGLSPEQFKAVKSERTIGATIEILYTVHHNGQCLGYIRFSGKNGEGTVDITNRNARLELENLDFGPTDKQNKAHLAGEHGDGLKVAILVYMRSSQSHIIKFQASGGYLLL